MRGKLLLKTGRVGYQAQGREIALDTTVKSSKGIGRAFAPTWAMVKASKSGEINWATYTERYLKLLRERYQDDRASFQAAIRAEDLVLLCYCAADKNCHRHLLKEVLMKVAACEGIEVEDGGEVSN